MLALIVRRLLWMIPTLLIISFISFTIIQLPPGDYLTSYITTLQEMGETVEPEEIEALRKRYDLDQPFLVRYMRWLNGLLPIGFDVLRYGPLDGRDLGASGKEAGRWASAWRGEGTVRGKAVLLDGGGRAERQFEWQRPQGAGVLYFAAKVGWQRENRQGAARCGLEPPDPVGEVHWMAIGLVEGQFEAVCGAERKQWGSIGDKAHLLVAKLGLDASGRVTRMTLWADPDGPEQGGESVTLTPASPVDLPSPAVAILSCTGEGTASFDDLRIGTTWEAATRSLRGASQPGLVAADEFSYSYNRLGGWPKLKWPDMGMSLEWEQPVSKLIGERILLTTIISIVTLLFTWAIAVPIGIYSAVKQYSWGDYTFTFLGFIGLATPSFLLALIFMYVGYTVFGVSAGGLFSPEYQNASWSVGRVVDLFAHLWIPVLVIGTAGTAGLIRVMRGNLLDELRKQYVMTARAKGLPRWKLILKYPVRVALNPLISTVGWVLPAIVSGSTITSFVLGLPTTGPLLLRALMNQDMYLAGSMVMMLSFLTVIGTLISDLLLLWLDPRIRYGKREP